MMTSCFRRMGFAIVAAALWAAPCARGEEEKTTTPDFRTLILQELNEAYAVMTNSAFAALRQGDVAAFTDACPALVDPAGTNDLDLACLFYAAILDQSAAVAHLLALGMPVDGPDGSSEATPLHVALLGRSESVVDLLLEAGADVHRTNDFGMTALGCAVAARSTNRVKDLIARGVAVDPADGRSIPPFLLAVGTGDAEIARVLLAAGARVDQPAAYGGTALHMAAAENDAPLVQVLLEAGADVRATNEYGSTPLMTAAGNGARKCAQLLLDRGAQINAVDIYGHSAIARAIQRDQRDMLDFLADHGADLDATDALGWNLVQLAAGQDNADVVRWCAGRHVPLDEPNHDGKPALYLSARNGRTNAVLALLAAGADPNLAETNNLWTPLMVAARYDQPEIARQLLAAGAELERRNRAGMTAILLAACGASPEMIDLLLDAGARTDVFSAKGEGVLRNAIWETNLTVFTHFLERGVDPNLVPTNCWPLLANAAWHGRIDFVDALLAAGADPNLATPDGQIPLFIAMRRSQTNVVERLLAAGADPALRRNAEDLTPWHLAVLHGQRELAEKLAARMTPEQMEPTHLVRAYLDLDAPLATNVFVAGLFNEWDGTATPMARRVDDGWWYVELELFPGRYGYKFVVDGNWIEDPLAEASYRDGNRNTDNSMLDPELRRIETRPVRPLSSFASLVPIRFEYRDRNARYVAVAGEFNGWSAENHQLSLEKVGLWSAELRVPPGEYTYKFVVDGKWCLDPANALTKVVDGATNSLAIASPFAAPMPE